MTWLSVMVKCTWLLARVHYELTLVISYLTFVISSNITYGSIRLNPILSLDVSLCIILTKVGIKSCRCCSYIFATLVFVAKVNPNILLPLSCIFVYELIQARL